MKTRQLLSYFVFLTIAVIVSCHGSEREVVIGLRIKLFNYLKLTSEIILLVRVAVLRGQAKVLQEDSQYIIFFDHYLSTQYYFKLSFYYIQKYMNYRNIACVIE